MDSTEKLPTVLSLCTGYGGLELGLERVFGNISVLTHVEIEAFAIANLVNKMETGRVVPAPIWTDLKTLPLEPFRGRVDIITGGYPCQPFSAAGKRAGEDDPRHLFPYIKKIIAGVRPAWCFFENVEGHISLGLSTVISELEEMGYETTWGIFSAAEVGAPHQRKRVFILAHSSSSRPRNNIGQAGCETGSEVLRQGDRPERTVRIDSAGPGEELAHCEHINVQRKWSNNNQEGWEEQNGSFGLCYRTRWPARPGEPQYEWEEPRVCCKETVVDTRSTGSERSLGDAPESSQNRQNDRLPSQASEHRDSQTQPGVGRAVARSADRVDRLRLLGNGVVPQTAEKAFRVLHERIMSSDINYVKPEVQLELF